VNVGGTDARAVGLCLEVNDRTGTEELAVLVAVLAARIVDYPPPAAVMRDAAVRQHDFTGHLADLVGRLGEDRDVSDRRLGSKPKVSGPGEPPVVVRQLRGRPCHERSAIVAKNGPMMSIAST